MKQNIIRQVVDIQAQAERLIKTQADISQIVDFSKYNDDFVLKYVK